MSSTDPRSAAWRHAGAELGIDVTAPLELASQGGPLTYTAFVRCFGGPLGTVVFSAAESEPTRYWEAAKQAGYYCSRLGTDYDEFDRDLFVGTLNDWGWYGDPAEQPSWYSGNAWTR
jgi:hypothetical protein